WWRPAPPATAWLRSSAPVSTRSPAAARTCVSSMGAAETTSSRKEHGFNIMLTTSSDPIALDQQRVLQVYRRSPVVFESGRGCSLFTRDGQRYLDLISGVGVAALGHAHPALARAIADQAATLLHTSNLVH